MGHKNYLIKSFDYNGGALALLDAFRGQPNLFFLDSSLAHPVYGRYSFIGFDPVDTLTCKGEDVLSLLKDKYRFFGQNQAQKFTSELTPLTAGIVGCLSYDYGVQQECIPRQSADDHNLPDCFFGVYDCILTIDHFTRKVHIVSSGLPERKSRLREQKAKERLDSVVRLLDVSQQKGGKPPSGQRHKLMDNRLALRSNFTREQYCNAVRKALTYIEDGEIYQVNLSQRFEFDCGGYASDPLDLYCHLRHNSPAPFGGYMDGGTFHVMSHSPEQFLHVERNKQVRTRPMKGTRPRGHNRTCDRKMRDEILHSAKDKAELLMITDLMRNDLGRVCDFGSVVVQEMRALEEYNYVYQMTSTVEGRLLKDKDCFDLLRACFPGGSITGCPKIRAMSIIEELEPTLRSMYTGCLGYIGFAGNADFNILIRTLLAVQNKIYFQAGSGIVADSKPEQEFEESLIKAQAMRESLESMYLKRFPHRKSFKVSDPVLT